MIKKNLCRHGFCQELIIQSKKNVENNRVCIVERRLYYIYGWRQVPFNSSVIRKTAEQSRPEIAQSYVQKNKDLAAK